MSGSLGSTGPPGELYSGSITDEETKGGRGKLVWEGGMHTLVVGLDFDQGELGQTTNAGQVLQLFGAPATSSTSPDVERWAVYANDTIAVDRWSMTLGIRYDRNTITGSFVSPSLGLTYRLDDHSILKTSVARGFTMPPLGPTSGGGLFLDPNPNLEPEEVWSYQLGAESGLLKYLWVKASLFRHELDKALRRELFAAGPPSFNDLIVNAGKSRRQGFEMEVETLPIHRVSLFGGLAYVDIEPPNDFGANQIYSYNVGIRYDDRESLRADLFGHYVWWDADSRFGGSYDDFVWDFNVRKSFRLCVNAIPEIFFTVHNLFSGKQYPVGDSKNPERWFEAGVRIRF